jgi:fermentation-respiration switch protein FrsA (DUF1100 family)
MRSIIIVLLLLAHIANAQDERRVRQSAGHDSARAVIMMMIHKQYDEAYSRFSEKYRKTKTKTDLVEEWESSTAMKGDFIRFSDLKSTYIKQTLDPKYEDRVSVFADCEFLHGVVLVRVTCDIRDFTITEFKIFSPNKKPYRFDPNADTSLFSIKRVIIESVDKEILLPATITYPKNAKGRVPLVIFVHGSGPNDRDETIGPNKPFLDLANGLAMKGIASLRYDKRSYILPMWFSGRPFTVKDEVIDDALTALKYVRTLKNIDTKNICVLGHSLGAMLAPRIAEADRNIRGIIMMAAPARPLEDLVSAQTHYLVSIDSLNPRTLLDAQVKIIDSLVGQIKHLTKNDIDRTDLILGAPPAYYLDLRANDPVRSAAALTKQKILMLQGERDYQVTMNDLGMYKRSLTGKNVTFKSYPALNHLFLEGTGPSTPKEYDKAGKIPDYVIDDIARFILQ